MCIPGILFIISNAVIIYKYLIIIINYNYKYIYIYILLILLIIYIINNYKYKGPRWQSHRWGGRVISDPWPRGLEGLGG